MISTRCFLRDPDEASDRDTPRLPRWASERLESGCADVVDLRSRGEPLRAVLEDLAARVSRDEIACLVVPADGMLARDIDGSERVFSLLVAHDVPLVQGEHVNRPGDISYQIWRHVVQITAAAEFRLRRSRRWSVRAPSQPTSPPGMAVCAGSDAHTPAPVVLRPPGLAGATLDALFASIRAGGLVVVCHRDVLEVRPVAVERGRHRTADVRRAFAALGAPVRPDRLWARDLRLPFDQGELGHAVGDEVACLVARDGALLTCTPAGDARQHAMLRRHGVPVLVGASLAAAAAARDWGLLRAVDAPPTTPN